jgi:hypothetical protein
MPSISLEPDCLTPTGLHIINLSPETLAGNRWSRLAQIFAQNTLDIQGLRAVAVLAVMVSTRTELAAGRIHRCRYFLRHFRVSDRRSSGEK